MHKIMVVDDEADIRRLLEKRLKAEGYQVVAFENAVAALEALDAEMPDLVFMDVNMPLLDGVEACRRIAAKYPDLPVLFLTAHGDPADSFEAGGRDFISKPFNHVELLARIRARLKEKADRQMAARRSEAFEIAAISDPLTGLANRRYFDTRMPQEINRASRYGYDISAMMIDIDNFKSVNDTYGHPVGDKVIVQVAEVMKQALRAVDIIARYGGEEFVIILPETDLEETLRIAERVRATVAETPPPPPVPKVTISIGVSTGSNENLIERADRALYDAKRKGKNRVEVQV